MRSKWGPKASLVIGAGVLAALCAFAQGTEQVPRLPPEPANAPAPSLQANADPGYDSALAACKNPPRKMPPIHWPASGPPPRDYTVKEISGVIAAGQRWKFLWQAAGNNGDGIVATRDGGLLIAQNDNSDVVKLDKNGSASVAYTKTHTGGALSINAKGEIFAVERGLNPRIEELAPHRRVLADRYQGDTLDCLGGVMNDLTAARNGGAYFTMGAVYYASPKGVVTKYGADLRTNGIILSPDESKLYVTNGGSVVVFDVQSDGSLANQREFAKLLPKTYGDGSATDADGRIYVSSNPGVQVFASDGKYLGLIPSPRDEISISFGGRDRKTMFILARGAVDANGKQIANAAQVYSIQMIAKGYKGRPK
ncbi:MAG TPA: SMP-30/gluconolactonase/LRE family protein [Candidatus Dormibacteraeota bacterium]|nr:SMP-30/gluconolactonase/LRE family protein [Candidatus Dormibacteraeota bacterium]